MSVDDPFCPRHGRASRPVETLGLRCDCPSIIEAAVGALRRGKWVASALPLLPVPVSSELFDAVQARGERAVLDALMVGYELGLRGGVLPERVKTCPKCNKPFLVTSPLEKQIDECLNCWAQENP